MSDPGLTSNDQVDDEPVDYDQEVQEFYDTHSGEVRGYLRNVGTPAEYIDDIVHDAFLAARRTWGDPTDGQPTRLRLQGRPCPASTTSRQGLQAQPADRRWVADRSPTRPETLSTRSRRRDHRPARPRVCPRHVARAAAPGDSPTQDRGPQHRRNRGDPEHTGRHNQVGPKPRDGRSPEAARHR